MNSTHEFDRGSAPTPRAWRGFETPHAARSLRLQGRGDREFLRGYVRTVLGTLRDVHAVIGGTVLADLIAEGERALDRSLS